MNSTKDQTNPSHPKLALGIVLAFAALVIVTSVPHATHATPYSKEVAASTSVPILKESNTATELLADAETLAGEERYREAEILLTRLIQTDKDCPQAWRALTTVQRCVAEKSVASGDLMNAGRALEQARTSVASLRGLSIDPSIKEEPKALAKGLAEEEAAFKEVEAHLEAAASRVSNKHIERAISLAGEAHHWCWKNDREKIVSGLKELRAVTDFGPWVSRDVRSSTTDAMARLKELVTQEEWPSLLARAGFDITSGQSPKN